MPRKKTSSSTVTHVLISIGVAVVVVLVGMVAGIPFVFSHRVLPFVRLDSVSLTGVTYDAVPGVVHRYERELLSRTVTLTLKDQTRTESLKKLGVRVDIVATTRAIQATGARAVFSGQWALRPILKVNTPTLQQVVGSAFAATITPPRNATLKLNASPTLTLVKGEAGEAVDVVAFERDLVTSIMRNKKQPIALTLIQAPPAIQDHEVVAARAFAETMLRDGLRVTFEDRSWAVKPFTIRRLLRFTPTPDPADLANYILGVTFNEAGLADYLTKTIAPDIDTTAQNARFAIDAEGRVTQFALPQRGQALDVAETTRRANVLLATAPAELPLAVDITEPSIDSADDIAALGISKLLTTGETNFAGSPANRIHNIRVGTVRYHGLLIPPSQEFSFNEHLGPVTAAAGFKPELVIKHNVTTPEFGGGLCQVSTTLFRAAVQAGLEITVRRNHAYAVRYYGTPGFDATIYPPYTDLRFINNTPSYILVQARVDGTKLIFEFWGTDDGRVVEVTGPTPYDHEASGAVKATLQQRVIRADEVLIDKTFFSRYKSPDLFPKAVATDDPKRTTP